MQRIVTLENSQTFELPAGEFTVGDITDTSVTLVSENVKARPIQLTADAACNIDDISLTFVERHDNTAHVRVDCNKDFIASEMSVGGFDDDDKDRPNTVVVIAHR